MVVKRTGSEAWLEFGHACLLTSSSKFSPPRNGSNHHKVTMTLMWHDT